MPSLLSLTFPFSFVQLLCFVSIFLLKYYQTHFWLSCSVVTGDRADQLKYIFELALHFSPTRCWLHKQIPTKRWKEIELGWNLNILDCEWGGDEAVRAAGRHPAVGTAMSKRCGGVGRSALQGEGGGLHYGGGLQYTLPCKYCNHLNSTLTALNKMHILAYLCWMHNCAYLWKTPQFSFSKAQTLHWTLGRESQLGVNFIDVCICRAAMAEAGFLR